MCIRDRRRRARAARPRQAAQPPVHALDIFGWERKRTGWAFSLSPFLAVGGDVNAHNKVGGWQAAAGSRNDEMEPAIAM
eukprot:1487128-Pleurochrysis_carterae.AAC.1